jgi:carbon monoxide dehydrogenase subunit G
MKVRLEKTFPMPAAAEAAWALLQDIGGVAACMPGAKITEQLDATHYKGTIAVKIGPASLSFRGEIEVKSLDAAAKSLKLSAKGTDTTGTSGATMELSARVEAADAGSCNLVGESEVSVSGKAASFGARFMGPVADQVMKQFAANFAARLQAMPPPGAGSAQPAQGAAAPAPEAKPLNALALAWAVLKGWLRALLGKRA